MSNKKFIYPDFSKSIINVSSTIAEYLGGESRYQTLDILKEELEKGYKNIVFICFDGLGMNPLKVNLSKGDLFLRETKCILTSTFPATTTNATNSLLSNALPCEHGWFGWSLNIKKLNRNVDIFTKRDSRTGENIPDKKFPLERLDYYFDKLSSCDYEINTLFPDYVDITYASRNTVFETENEFFVKLNNICLKDGKQFCYAYYPDPDHTMHECGVSSPEAKKVISSLQNNIRELSEKLTDTLFIITADHGQVDITGHIEFYKDTKLLSMLKIYPYLDSRSPAFIVKDGMDKQFEDYFNSKYSKDFELHKTSELIEMGIFGNEFSDESFIHSLGDYIAFGTYTHKQGVLTPKSRYFKGGHASLTEEMEVPLILIKSKN